MNEAINKGTEIFFKIKEGNIFAFNISDIIWIVGILVVAFFAIKISVKFLKVVLIILAILFLVGFLITSGVIPIELPFISEAAQSFFSTIGI